MWCLDKGGLGYKYITPDIETHLLGTYEDIGFTEVPYWKAISGDIHTLLVRLGA